MQPAGLDPRGLESRGGASARGHSQSSLWPHPRGRGESQTALQSQRPPEQPGLRAPYSQVSLPPMPLTETFPLRLLATHRGSSAVG